MLPGVPLSGSMPKVTRFLGPSEDPLPAVPGVLVADLGVPDAGPKLLLLVGDSTLVPNLSKLVTFCSLQRQSWVLSHALQPMQTHCALSLVACKQSHKRLDILHQCTAGAEGSRMTCERNWVQPGCYSRNMSENVSACMLMFSVRRNNGLGALPCPGKTMTARWPTCCAEEAAEPADHPRGCLASQMTESALRTQLSRQKSSEQHWLGAASWLSHLGLAGHRRPNLPASTPDNA